MPLAVGLALGGALAARTPADSYRGLSVLRTWREGEVAHLYRVPLRAGDFVRIAADQRASDVELEVLAPGAAEPTVVDGLTYASGVDGFELIASSSGEARVRVVLDRAIGTAPSYQLTISSPHRATGIERSRAAAYAAFEASRALPAEQAIPLLERALGWAKQAKARDLSARIYDRLGRRFLPKDDAVALTHFRAAAALAEEPQLQATQWHKVGMVLAEQQRFEEAAVAYHVERRIGLRSADLVRQAYAFDGLGSLSRARGRFEQALSFSRQGLRLWRQLGDRGKQVGTQDALGTLFLELGDPEQAVVEAKAGLALDPAPGPRIDLLQRLASAYREREQWDRVRRTLNQALAAARRLGDRDREASCLLTLGAVELDLWRTPEALRYLKPAEEILRHEGDNASALANIEVMLGVIATRRGDVPTALRLIESSLAGYGRLGMDNERAWVLSRRSDALRQGGRFAEARADLDQAIAILESLRPGLEPQLRAKLLAMRHRFFDRLVDLLVERKELRAAFEASERSRARSLLDEISGREVAPPRSLAEIERSLPAGTVLLDFWLGETRSFVWVLRGKELALHVLPAQAEIEARSRLATRALGMPPGRLAARERRIAFLAQTLLGGIAGRLAGTRFVVVPDGELFTVPFAALPIPGSATDGTLERLIDRGAVITLPSASLALEIHDAVARRPAGEGLLAVGDPVFGCPDDRLRCKPAAVDAPTLLGGIGARVGAWFAPPGKDERDATAGDLLRIGRTGSEVAAIARLAGPEEATERIGFAASRSAVLQAPLESFRILHFATHGLVDPARPTHSGLALARVTPEGARVPGDTFLRLGDLAGRRLRADLVVLSACDTALGRETRGEGPESLGRAFLAAGAANALVSLWRVDDSSTEELMVGFYRELLGRGLSAAAALRQSQLAVRSRPEWSDPYYWGAFVLQGDWRDDVHETENVFNETNRKVSFEVGMSRAPVPRRLR